MKQRIKKYVFSAANKTLTLPDFLQVDVGNLLLVTNVTRQTALFNFYDPSIGSVDLAGPDTFVFTADTSTMLDGDRILVHYEVSPGEPYYDPNVMVEFDRNTPLAVENRWNGNAPVDTAPGVPLVSLAGSLGEPIDSRQGGIQTFQVNQPDNITPPILPGVPNSQGNTMGAVAGGVWTVPYTVAVGQTLVFDVSNYRGLAISVPSTQGQLAWFQSNYPDRNFAAFSMLHPSTGAVSTGNGGGGTTTAFWIGTLNCRYFALTSATVASSGVLHFTAMPSAPPITTFPSFTVNNADAQGTSGQGMNVISQAWVQRGWTPATIATEVTGTNMDRQRSVINKMESTGIGITAAGVMGQFDDVSPYTATEDRFYVARLTRNRSQHQVIRDGHSAATEMGAAVTGRNALVVEDANAFLMSSGYPELEVTPGVPGVALVDEMGEPLETRGGAIAFFDATQERQRVPFSDLGVNTAGVLASGTLLSIVATNVNAAMRYLQLFNGAPSAGAKPVLSFPLPAGTATAPGSVALGVDVLGANGTPFMGVVGWGISTVASSYTAATAADHTVNGISR